LSEKIIRRRPGTRLISVDARVLGLVFSAAIAVMFSTPVTDTFAADTPLLEPYNLIVDRSLVREQADAQIIAARRYDTFWNTGDEALARAALAPNFIDNTLPTGRPQGLAGPLAASKLIRLAIPDIRCEIEQMIVAGDRVVAPAFPRSLHRTLRADARPRPDDQLHRHRHLPRRRWTHR
jgi:hypothetical protein